MNIYYPYGTFDGVGSFAMEHYKYLKWLHRDSLNALIHEGILNEYLRDVDRKAHKQIRDYMKKAPYHGLSYHFRIALRAILRIKFRNRQQIVHCFLAVHRRYCPAGECPILIRWHLGELGIDILPEFFQGISGVFPSSQPSAMQGLIRHERVIRLFFFPGYMSVKAGIDWYYDDGLLLFPITESKRKQITFNQADTVDTSRPNTMVLRFRQLVIDTKRFQIEIDERIEGVSG